MDVYFIEKTPAVLEELQRAQKLNAEGANQDCLNILMSLYEAGRVLTKQPDVQPAMYGMPQQPV
jgi:hypothetical protein